MKPNWKFDLKGLKKINKMYLLLAALTGILLLVIAIPTEDKKKETQTVRQEAADTEGFGQTDTENAYRRNLERQLEEMLSAMEGVGKTEVMITFADSGEYVVEKDMTRNQEATEETDSQGSSRKSNIVSSQEETIYTRDGTEQGEPFVSREVNPRVEGVLVVAEGGKNAVVVKNISDAILALFPIEAHKIKVVNMN